MFKSPIRLVSEGIPYLLPMKDRSPGIHQSDVIRDLAMRLGHFKPSPINMTRLQLGKAMEFALMQMRALHFPDEYVQPGELIVDDFPGTPDIVGVKIGSVEEDKLTWMSSTHPADSDNFLWYWVQIAGYLHRLGLNLGRVNVTHVNGDYRGSGPIHRVWEREFTDRELKGCWKMLLRHRDEMAEMAER
jgi:hypothetical protein